MTFGDLLQEWIDGYRRRTVAATFALCLDAVPSLAPFELRSVEAITADEVGEYVAALARDDLRKADWTLRTLQFVLAEARASGCAVDDAVFHARPRGETDRVLLWEDVDELAFHTREPYDVLVRVAALTGLRQHELFGLNSARIDFDASSVDVGRRVDLSEDAAWLLREQRPDAHGLLFPPLGGDAFRRTIFAPACRRAGLDGVRFADLRRAFAGMWIAAGAPPPYLQTQLGHSSIRATLAYYDRFFESEADRWGVEPALIRLAQRYGLEISCGFRSTEKNRSVGGAARSAHLEGRAIDVAPGSGVLRLAEEVKQSPAAFAEFYYDPLGWFVQDGRVLEGGVPGHTDHAHVALARDGF